VAEAAADDSCALEQELVALMSDAKYGASATGLGALWERIPKTGPKSLGAALYHRVDEKDDIYEFIKGDIRLFCFEADGAIVVCSHAIIKKSQKTKRKDIAPAIALKERYLVAEKTGRISFVGS
jgi:hypothetical protein